MKTVKRKPHWPKWANYKATDYVGEIWFYRNEPYMLATRWDESHETRFYKTKKNYKGDWTKSLRKIED